LVEELNREYPQIEHSATPAVEESAAEPIAAGLGSPVLSLA
jgi:hypothetical protein